MSRVPFTLRQLEYFDAIAAEGTLLAAADRCHVSASALTLAIDELERHLSLQLLVRRKGRGVTLTPAGSRVLSHARRVLAGVDSLVSDAWEAGTGLTGRFGIGCFSTLAPFFLPSIMEDFTSGHPGLTLELVEASAPELHELLLQGRIDAALMYSVDVSDRLTFEPVLGYEPHVIVAEGHVLAHRDSVQLRELLAEPLIMLDLSPTRQNTESIFDALGLQPKIGHRTASFELARCLVGRGLGYAILFQRPESVVTYDGHSVRILEIADRVPDTIVGLARPHGAPRTARLQALEEFLQKEHA